MVATFLETANLVQLLFFFYFKKCLLDCLGQQYVKDGLDLAIVVKQIIVFNLGDLIYSCLLRNVGRSGWARLKFICLNLTVNLLRLFFALFSQVIGQIYLDAGRGAWSQVVRRDLILRFLEFNELLLDHFELALLTLSFES